MVLLRDGRTLIGYLRSVDQFANLVLHKTIERIHVGSEYGDIPRGIFIIRGENVVLLGEIVSIKVRLPIQKDNHWFWLVFSTGSGTGEDTATERDLYRRHSRLATSHTGTAPGETSADSQGTKRARPQRGNDPG